MVSHRADSSISGLNYEFSNLTHDVSSRTDSIGPGPGDIHGGHATVADSKEICENIPSQTAWTETCDNGPSQTTWTEACDNGPSQTAWTDVVTSRPRSEPLAESIESPSNLRVIKKSKSPRGSTTPRSRKSKIASCPSPQAPLSELTKDSEVALKDINAWVHRSTETRLDKVAKCDGYIARPMNSFMLYRSAYAERTKEWCRQNNHQVVSSVCGKSWSLESKEVHEQYEAFAKVERENHAKAHPHYKFSPAKTAVKRQRSAVDEEGDRYERTGHDGAYRDYRNSRQRKNAYLSAAGLPMSKIRAAYPYHPEHHRPPMTHYAQSAAGNTGFIRMQHFQEAIYDQHHLPQDQYSHFDAGLHLSRMHISPAPLEYGSASGHVLPSSHSASSTMSSTPAHASTQQPSHNSWWQHNFSFQHPPVLRTLPSQHNEQQTQACAPGTSQTAIDPALYVVTDPEGPVRAGDRTEGLDLDESMQGIAPSEFTQWANWSM